MIKTQEILNEVLVELFNDILKIEEKSLQSQNINDLTMNEIHTIEAIGINLKKPMGEVANELKISVGTLTTAINRLIQKGYVTRNKDEKDKRIVLVSLTKSGEEIYKIHKNFHDEMIEYVINKTNDDEKELLNNLLKKIKIFFDEKYAYLKKWFFNFLLINLKESFFVNFCWW